MPRRTGASVYAKRPLSVKGVLPLTRNTTFHTLPPAGVTLEPPLAEPSWAARPKREPGGQKKIASRAGKTLINFAPLGNGGPGGLQKWCSRARETPTFSKRCAPVYVKHSLGKQGWSTRPPQDTQLAVPGTHFGEALINVTSQMVTGVCEAVGHGLTTAQAGSIRADSGRAVLKLWL